MGSAQHWSVTVELVTLTSFQHQPLECFSTWAKPGERNEEDVKIQLICGQDRTSPRPPKARQLFTGGEGI